MKLSEYKDEQALDLLADIIEPLSDILTDEEVRSAAQKGSKFKAISIAIKKHKQSVMSIMATLDGVPVEEYHCNVISLPRTIIELLNDPDIGQLFTFAGQTEESTPSGSLTENTEAGEQ